ncbi:hypothetical protein IW262DRAFT_1292971 [Armillaria fumosa]|nr:hypothetical protein IW262DRAFT_1292971 [Armillaria fumosa]
MQETTGAKAVLPPSCIRLHSTATATNPTVYAQGRSTLIPCSSIGILAACALLVMWAMDCPFSASQSLLQRSPSALANLDCVSRSIWTMDSIAELPGCLNGQWRGWINERDTSFELNVSKDCEDPKAIPANLTHLATTQTTWSSLLAHSKNTVNIIKTYRTLNTFIQDPFR